MNMIEAAKETVSFALSKGYSSVESDPVMQCLDYPHIQEMLNTMQTTEMSPAKLGRWLGWLQAACVYGTLGAVTLDDCKKINMKYAD